MLGEVFMKFVKSLSCIMAVLVLFVMAGCGPTNLSNATGEMRVLKDSTGTEVTIPVHPMRIVSMGVSTDDIVIPLTGTERIVAISDLLPNLEADAAKIKGRVKYSTESVMSFQPDLVILPSWMSTDFIKELRQLKIPVYVYAYPNTIEGTEKLITELGTVVNEPEKAKALRENVATRVAKLEDFTKKIAPDKVKTAIYYSSLGVLGGEKSTFDNFCHVTNIKNGAALAGLKDNARGTKEVIVQVNPDVIFMPSSAYDKDQYKAAGKEELYDDPSLKDVKAIKNKAIYIIDARWFLSYSQFSVNAMEQMAELAYGYKK